MKSVEFALIIPLFSLACGTSDPCSSTKFAPGGFKLGENVAQYEVFLDHRCPSQSFVLAGKAVGKTIDLPEGTIGLTVQMSSADCTVVNRLGTFNNETNVQVTNAGGSSDAVRCVIRVLTPNVAVRNGTSLGVAVGQLDILATLASVPCKFTGDVPIGSDIGGEQLETRSCN